MTFRELEKRNRELNKMIVNLEEENQHLFDHYELSPVACMTTNKKGIIIEINKTGADMLGISKTKLLHQPIIKYVEKKDYDTLNLHFQRVFKCLDHQSCEIMFLKKDGSHFYGQLESNCIENNGVPLARCRTILIDITARKLVERAMRERKLKKINVLNALPDILFIQDKNGVYVDCHAPDLDKLHPSPKAFLGKHIDEIFPQNIAKPMNQAFKKVMKSGELIKLEYFLPISDMLRYYETRMVRVYGDMVLSVVRDITEQTRAEKVLQAAHNMLERRVKERTAEIDKINVRLKKEIVERKKMEKVRQKAQRMETIGSLASGVAHEVRNPLNSIQAIVAVLNQELGENEEFQSCSEHINTQVERLSRLMRDLLELGKQNQEEFLKIESVPNICYSAINLWKQSGQKQSHIVNVIKEERADKVNILGDAGKLQQVFINLLENATQHSPEGSEIKIYIKKPTKKYIRISVIDQGNGVNPENLNKVFEPFFTKRHSGTGLGLSIVKNIIENHGGRIKMSNKKPPPGCIVDFRLPLVDLKKG